MGVLDGKVAVITASGSGMGRATAIRMAEEGAHVIVADVDPAGAAETVATIESSGGKARAHAVDVTDVAAIGDLFDAVERDHGHLDVLFAHAGAPGPSGLQISEEDWAQTIDINLKSAFFCVSRAERLLRAAPTASVLMTSSVSGLVGSPLSPLYSLTKGGIVTFGKALALALAPHIRVNVICPGPVDTPMLPRFFGRDPGADVAAMMQSFLDTSVPLRRRAQPVEIAEAAVFLASDAASFITGVALPVDGGYLAR